MTDATDRAFLDGLYAHACAGDEDAAVDYVYREIDERLLAHKFDAVARILVSIDVARLPVLLSLGVASITNAARRELADARATYLARLRAHLTIVEHARVDELLAGLE